MMSGKYSILARDAMLMAAVSRRLSERNSQINDLLRERFRSVDHESVWRLAQAEAEFIKNERLEERKLEYTRKMWEDEPQNKREISTTGNGHSPVGTEPEQYDSDGTWSATTTECASEMKSEWEVDPHAAEKWDSSTCGWWDDPSPGLNGTADQFSVAEIASREHDLEDDEEAMPWDEDYDSDEAEDEIWSTSSSNDQIDGVHWTAHNFEPEPVQHEETENIPKREQGNPPNIHNDLNPDFNWSEDRTAIQPSDQDNESTNGHDDTSKTEQTTTTTTTQNPPPTGSPPPPTPLITSSPSPAAHDDKTTLEQAAWKTIGRILADVDFEEHASAWAAATRALAHRLRARGADCRHHRAHRTQAVCDAEQQQRAVSVSCCCCCCWDRRIFNVVVVAVAVDAAVGWGAAPECPCRGRPGEGDREEDALRCPFNRRRWWRWQRRQAMAAGRGCACGRGDCGLLLRGSSSGLRTSLAMGGDLPVEETMGEGL